MQEHTVQDDDGGITFIGKQLAFASSSAPGKTRWSELTLFITEGGKYVVAGAGISRVPGEENRRWAVVVDDAIAVVAKLTLHSEAGVHYIPHVPNRRVLSDASILDPELHTAFYNRRIA